MVLQTMQLMPCGDRQEIGFFLWNTSLGAATIGLVLCATPRIRDFECCRAANVNSWQASLNSPLLTKSCCATLRLELKPRDCSLSTPATKFTCAARHAGLCRQVTFSPALIVGSRVCQGASQSRLLHCLARDNPGCHNKLETLRSNLHDVG
jgi:hypothetical protein